MLTVNDAQDGDYVLLIEDLGMLCKLPPLWPWLSIAFLKHLAKKRETKKPPTISNSDCLGGCLDVSNAEVDLITSSDSCDSVSGELQQRTDLNLTPRKFKLWCAHGC